VALSYFLLVAGYDFKEYKIMLSQIETTIAKLLK
jgi:hypothetical protein